MRRVLGVIAGVIAGSVTVALVEYASHMLYPLPEGMNPMDPAQHDAFVAFVKTLPVGAFLLVLAGWAMGNLVGSLVAATITIRPVPVMVVTGIGLLAAGFNLYTIPHPWWMAVLALAAYPATGYLAWRIAVSGQPADFTSSQT